MARSGRSFSPVAGIQWVETFANRRADCSRGVYVSVPLPGFSGLRQPLRSYDDFPRKSFSPVAGIQWVETFMLLAVSSSLSPCSVSVPLPGFSGLRHSGI